MSFLLVPPVEVVAPNFELAQVNAAKHRVHQDQVLKELGLQKETEQVKFGAFRGTKIFPWQQDSDAVLITKFFYAGKEKNAFFIADILLKKDTCTFLGATWSFASPPSGTPQASSVSLTQFATRSFSFVTPFQMQLEVVESPPGIPVKDVLDVLLSETLAAQQIPVDSEQSRQYCYFNPRSPEGSPPKTYPARPHRVVLGKLVTRNGKDKDWPMLSGNFAMYTGTFDKKNAEILALDPQKSFNPTDIANALAQKLVPSVHNLADKEFKVFKRRGRWVYIERGFAFGLPIGMHMVGPHNAQLHIIQYAPEEEGVVDAAIAFLRTEDKQNPIKEGDMLKIDPTLYPKKPLQKSN